MNEHPDHGDDPHHGGEDEEHGYGVADVPRFQAGLAVRGALLILAGLGMISGGLRTFRNHHVLGLPFAIAGVAGGLTSIWAGIIHITGGERFDDHPFL
ncbi:MAG: hypothetical protein KC482_00620 [Dehalococcoidia bacterium]|nr:hypothetical protein [Dehalococcoidia bacterium]MCA9843070.1 hypothetical protein [Dehalococcoidia bacterium]MCA9852103.1 hypothetical protein [Dehalococcoidia bacterium]